MLTAALEAEGVGPTQALRIWNRFYYGQPWGLGMLPMTPEHADEHRAQERAAFPAGQTASERVAAMLEAAGMAPAKTEADDAD